MMGTRAAAIVILACGLMDRCGERAGMDEGPVTGLDTGVAGDEAQAPGDAEAAGTAAVDPTAGKTMVTLRSLPPGAEVTVDGEEKGETPVIFWVDTTSEDADLGVALEMEWYLDVEDLLIVPKSGWSEGSGHGRKVDETFAISGDGSKARKIEITYLMVGLCEDAVADFGALVAQAERWTSACNAGENDGCTFVVTIGKGGKLETVDYLACLDPEMEKCTQKVLKKARFGKGEERQERFTWLGG